MNRSLITINENLRPYIEDHDHNGYFPTSYGFNWCDYRLMMPWHYLLTDEDGVIDHWVVSELWHDFQFIKHPDGQVYLHTNSGNLTVPTLLNRDFNLPIKTLLYDMTPLYHQIGEAPFIERKSCMKPDVGGGYYAEYASGLDDNLRQKVFVCPRNMSPSEHDRK